ncbi:hypothetical protein G6O52_25460, partial [Salmonella enterica subsp. enterica serovar Heidelberg]|uniref:hypothetical protein n=1 Tax=Salmonella enterica TaxID=28901 RepID=UPI0016547EBC
DHQNRRTPRCAAREGGSHSVIEWGRAGRCLPVVHDDEVYRGSHQAEGEAGDKDSAHDRADVGMVAPMKDEPRAA